MNIISKISTPIKKLILNSSTCSEARFTKEAKKIPYKKDMLVNSYNSNLEGGVEPPVFLTYCKELMIEKLLDQAEYSFDNVLVINNPFKISPLEHNNDSIYTLGKKGKMKHKTGVGPSLAMETQTHMVLIYKQLNTPIYVGQLRHETNSVTFPYMSP